MRASDWTAALVGQARFERVELAADFLDRGRVRLLLERRVELFGEARDQIFKRRCVDRGRLRGARGDARGELVAEVVDPLPEFVEALLAAGVRDDAVELGGERFETAAERVETRTRLFRDDRADRARDFAHVESDGGLGGAAAGARQQFELAA